jgi:colanic acid biosynthesis protein WcaH
MNKKNWIEENLYEKIQRLTPIATVGLLVVHKERLLLMLRNNEPAKNEWFTPGGRILYGETLEDAVKRVLKEKTGLTPLKIRRKGIMSHIWPNSHHIAIFYRVDVSEDEVKINEEHRAFKWISKVTDELHPYLKGMIQESEIFSQ